MNAEHTGIRVAVHSPRRLLRDTLATCLAVRPDVTVVGRVAEPGGILPLCELRHPDVVILDAERRLGELAGLVSRLVRRFPHLNVIVTYTGASRQEVAAACRAGVGSLVPESRGLEAVLALLLGRRRAHAAPASLERGGLSDTEHQIILLTGSGHSTREIATLLALSPSTVENLKRRLYAKLEVASGAHAVARAASLGLLDQARPPMARADGPGLAGDRHRPAASAGGLLAVVTGRAGPVLDRLAAVLLRGKTPFVLAPGPWATSGDPHWARWHRGPIVAVLADPAPADWELAAELGVPAVLVHSQPLGSPGLAEALAHGASALVAADRVDEHFPAMLAMAGQGYLVVDSMPMRPLIGAAQARWDGQVPGPVALPELTPRESDVLGSLAAGRSIRQTARALGIAPKTVENVQTRLFRKLGVRNRPGALAVASALGLLPAEPSDPVPAGRSDVTATGLTR